MPSSDYSRNVFINRPFDPKHKPLFRAMVFAVHDCGFIARCALETEDGGEVRIRKIVQIMRESRYGIHDISRTELDRGTRFPRFNMPLELGMFLGAKEFGHKEQRLKSCLILDRERYRYQAFCSDIAGQDIRAHHGDPAAAIMSVRNFLANQLSSVLLPGGGKMAERYRGVPEGHPEHRSPVPPLRERAQLHRVEELRPRIPGGKPVVNKRYRRSASHAACMRAPRRVTRR